MKSFFKIILLVALWFKASSSDGDFATPRDISKTASCDSFCSDDLEVNHDSVFAQNLFGQLQMGNVSLDDDDFSIASGDEPVTQGSVFVQLALPRFVQYVDPMQMVQDSDKELSRSSLDRCSIIDNFHSSFPEVAQAAPPEAVVSVPKFQKIVNDFKTKQFINAFHKAYLKKASSNNVEELRQDLFRCGVYDPAARQEVMKKLMLLDNIAQMLEDKQISSVNARDQINFLRKECFGLLVNVKLCSDKS